MNEQSESRAMLAILAKERRRQQVNKAASAANMSTLPAPPKGIILPRWRAMVNSILNRGLPT